MAGMILNPAWNGILDRQGQPLAGGRVYVFEAGTNTPVNLYVDSALTVEASWPIILNGEGRATVYGSGRYKLVIKDSLEAAITIVDHVILEDPNATNDPINVESTSAPQLRLGYDGNNALEVSVGATGSVTVNYDGSLLTFAKSVKFNSTVEVPSVNITDIWANNLNWGISAGHSLAKVKLIANTLILGGRFTRLISPSGTGILTLPWAPNKQITVSGFGLISGTTKANTWITVTIAGGVQAEFQSGVSNIGDLIELYGLVIPLS